MVLLHRDTGSDRGGDRLVGRATTVDRIHLFVDLGEEFMVTEERELLLSDLDRASTELRNQDLVTGSNTGSDPLALLVQGAGADGEHLGLIKFLDSTVRKEDSGCGLGLGLDALDEDAVEKRGDAADGLDGRHCDEDGKGGILEEDGGVDMGIEKT